MKRVRSILLIVVAAILVLCLVVVMVSVLGNRGLSAEPQVTGCLDPLDKARLEEALHLRQQLGESVWPGWGSAKSPVLLWNRHDSFLVAYPSLPAGWTLVSGDTFQDSPYYHQPTVDPQNFALQVDERWVASMATKWEMDAFMIELFRGILPPGIKAVFPYWLLVLPSEVQITGVLHESFHVYQAEVSGSRLQDAESAHRLGAAYWQADEAMRADWKQETALLARALAASSDSEARQLAVQFLEQRAQRRQAHGLAQDLVGYERQLEWEEGLAKYVELAIWRQASAAQEYQPVAAMSTDRQFKRYATFQQRWRQEVRQMQTQAGREGETRFYYTGMAQAMLLDRLLPEWKDGAFALGAWLETDLEEAVK
jgi:hypothetical protein